MLLNGIRQKLEAAVADREGELQRLAYAAAAGSGVDVTIPGTPYARGGLHLLTQIRREIEDIFLGMGYEVWDGAEVATVWENFDALNTDQATRRVRSSTPSTSTTTRSCARRRRRTRSAR